MCDQRFYEFLISNNRLSLVKLNDDKFISANDYSNMRDIIVDKRRLKIFFKDLINKSKNPGTDYMDYIAENKIDESLRKINNMIGTMP